MGKPKVEDFEQPDLRDGVAYERFHAFHSEIQNLQETVGVEAALDLDEKDPWADALTLLQVAIDGSSSLTAIDKKFLLSKKGEALLESGAGRIVGSYFQRKSK